MDRSTSRIMTPAVGAVIALLLGTAGVARSQSAAEHIALGDREHAARNPPRALQHYEAAIAADPNEYDALVKRRVRCAWSSASSSRTPNGAPRCTEAPNSTRGAPSRQIRDDAEGHFQLARALGRNALTMGTRDRIKYGERGARAGARGARRSTRSIPARCTSWACGTPRSCALNGFSRMIAKNFLGGKIFDAANWDNAQKYLEERRRRGSDAHRAPPRPGGGVRRPRSDARRRSSSTSGSLARRSRTTTIRTTRPTRCATPHGASLHARELRHRSVVADSSSRLRRSRQRVWHRARRNAARRVSSPLCGAVSRAAAAPSSAPTAMPAAKISRRDLAAIGVHRRPAGSTAQVSLCQWVPSAAHRWRGERARRRIGPA